MTDIMLYCIHINCLVFNKNASRLTFKGRSKLSPSFIIQPLDNFFLIPTVRFGHLKCSLQIKKKKGNTYEKREDKYFLYFKVTRATINDYIGYVVRLVHLKAVYLSFRVDQIVWQKI